MPEIAQFYGIVLKMYFKEPKQIYAIYGDYLGVFSLNTSEMTNGNLPNRAQQLVKEWFKIHQNELIEMWDKQQVHSLPPLK